MARGALFLLCASAAFSVAAGCDPADTSPPADLPRCAAGAGPIARVSPADGQTRALRRPTFVVTMSEEIDCSKITTTGFTLTDGGGNSAELGAVKCEAGNPTTVTFTPKDDLAFSTPHELVLTGLVDGSDQLIPACRVDFTTKSKTVLVAAGGDNMALDEDGALWSWGDALSPTAHSEVPSSVPLQVPLTGKVVAVASSEAFRVAALEDGTVWAWGENIHRQLGDGTTETRASPVQVKLDLPPGVTVIAVSAGASHALAVRSDGKVMAWGSNGAGQLGDGTKDERALPIEVPGIPAMSAVVAAQGPSGLGSMDGGFSLALAEDGTVWGWGSNNVGQLGQATSLEDAERPTPTAIPSLSGVKQIAAGWGDAFALVEGGKLFGWGDTLAGGAGDGRCNFPEPILPTEILVDEAAFVTAGRNYGLAVRLDGTLWGWGADATGVLGDGTTGATVDCNHDFEAVENIRPDPVQAIGLTGVVLVSGAERHALAVDGEGKVWAAGYDPNGVLGVGPDVEKLPGDAVATYARVPGL